MKYQASSSSTEFKADSLWNDINTNNKLDEYSFYKLDQTLIGSYKFFIQATQTGSSLSPNSKIFN
jgi:hypothetical protein